jgi:Na+/H+ antiporter NhaD/arsenite permease-like protein
VLPRLVDWNTIVTLTGLLLITTGIKESRLFYFVAYRISHRIDNERLLALFLISVSAILSTFLTNDIALFIIVPLTLSLQEISDNDYTKIIVLEAIAVNAGSSLTSIGNPQNIFLWHQWGISFLIFIKEMAPLVSMMSIWLFIFTFFSFSSVKIKITNRQQPVTDHGLFCLSAALLIAFILSVELQCEIYLLLITFISLLFTHRKVIFKTDWGLILLFIVIFIDLNLICQLKAVQGLPAMLNFNNAHTLFLSSAFLSQAISNVPSAILLAHYSSNFKIIAYGVNIGGNGLLISSFANLIALRFMKGRSKYLLFHVYSLPYFIATLIFSYYLLI